MSRLLINRRYLDLSSSYGDVLVGADRFTKKRLVGYFLLIAILFFVNRLGLAGNLASYGVLIILAARSGEGVIKALSLSTIILFANPYLIEIHPVVTFLRFILLFVACARVLWDAKKGGVNLIRIKHLNALLAFGFVCTVLSLLSRYYLSVSLLKLFTFILGAYTLLLAAHIYRQIGTSLACWFTSISYFIIVCSVYAYMSGIGYVTHGMLSEIGGTTGISGITGHPQSLGTLTALMVVFCLSLYVFSPYRLRWVAGLAILPLLALGYASAARTGFLAAILAILFALLLIFLPRHTSPKRRLTNVSPIQAFGIILAIGSCLIFVDLVRDGVVRKQVEEFLLKAVRTQTTEVDFSVDEVLSSRTNLIRFSWNNFIQSPITGIGFGTSYDPYFQEKATLFTAPVEKGFLPTALLEETGIPGTVFFMFFIGLVCHYLWSARNLIGMVVLIAVLLINLGEVNIFSLGGLGLVSWCIIASAIIVGRSPREKTRWNWLNRRMLIRPRQFHVQHDPQKLAKDPELAAD